MGDELARKFDFLKLIAMLVLIQNTGISTKIKEDLK